jgi:hypothetical protein
VTQSEPDGQTPSLDDASGNAGSSTPRPEAQAPPPPPAIVVPPADEPFSTPARAVMANLIVLAFLFAFVIGRLLAPALLGWRTGIERWIRQADVGSAVLGQLALVTGVVLAVHYMYVAVRSSELNIGFRLAIAPLTAGLVTLSFAAGARDLPLLLVVVMVVLATLLALSASISMLASAHTRAAGVVLGATAIAAFLELTARVLAVRASQDALTGMFRAAQILATLSFATEVVLLGVAAAWLASRRWIALAIIASSVWLFSGLLAWQAMVGSAYGASPTQVLLHRMLGELARNPWPLVPSWLYFTVEIAALLSVPIALFGRRTQPICRSAIALALLCRGDADLPLVALALGLSALVGAVASAREIPPPLPALPPLPPSIAPTASA